MHRDDAMRAAFVGMIGLFVVGACGGKVAPGGPGGELPPPVGPGPYVQPLPPDDEPGYPGQPDPAVTYPAIGETRPIPHACGADAAPCADDVCETPTCLRAAHVASRFGDYVMAEGTMMIFATRDVEANTLNGAIATLRAPNQDPQAFEVRSGIGFVRVLQQGGPPLAVWTMQSLTVTAGTLSFVGDAAAMIATRSEVAVEKGATLDAGAHGLVPGPGGAAGGTFRTAGAGCGGGGAPRGTGTSGDTGSTDGGGGGGGFGTVGGPGGGFDASGRGAAGQTCGDGLLTTLLGGSGGAGADTSGYVAGAFGGGGALQLVSLGRIRIEGAVTAGGGGGRTAEGNYRDGAGGGSGGAIYLEAPEIAIAASGGLYANGGGGGSSSAGTGFACSGSPSVAEDGRASMVPAKGSRCGEGHGGDGAAGAFQAEAGGTAGAAGGGGGGLGRIVLATTAGNVLATGGARTSPSPARTWMASSPGE